MSTAEQTDRVELSGGYRLEVQIMEDTWRGKDTVKFYAMANEPPPMVGTYAPGQIQRHRRREAPEVEITPPFSDNHRYREWGPADEPEYGFITNDNKRMTPAAAKAVAEMMLIAADFLNTLHVQAADRLLKQERLHKEHIEAEIKFEKERNEKRNKLKEELQWFVGQKFKLKRDGYKATVFGTIDRFTDTHVYTTSERGVRMSTQIEDINFFAIMYDGERRYTKVFERPAR